MAMLTRRSKLRRFLAGLMLASMALFLMTPLLAAPVAVAGDCPPAPAGSGPVLVAGMDSAACEHAAARPCVTALGCIVVAPALRPAPPLLVAFSKMLVAGVAPTPRGHELFRSRPPTPPPNHI